MSANIKTVCTNILEAKLKNNILEINLFNPKVLNKFTTFLHRHIKEEFEPKKHWKLRCLYVALKILDKTKQLTQKAKQLNKKKEGVGEF